MDEFIHYFVPYLLPSFALGALNGIVLLMSNWFVNFMWRKASKVSTKSRAIVLYVGVQLGGVLILVACMGLAFTGIKYFFKPHDAASPLAMIFAFGVTVAIAAKQKWFRPAVTSFKQFTTEKPPGA